MPNIPVAKLRGILTRATERSYNRISVDGDTSTNDTVVLLANGCSGVRPDPKEFAAFEEGVAVGDGNAGPADRARWRGRARS